MNEGGKSGAASMAKPLSDLPPLREVIAQHGLSASKALGQNFLLDQQLLARIARIPGALEGDLVYEVGPGPGGLTRALLDTGARVIAVERDRRCLPALMDLRAVAGEFMRISPSTNAAAPASQTSRTTDSRVARASGDIVRPSARRAQRRRRPSPRRACA